MYGTASKKVFEEISEILGVDHESVVSMQVYRDLIIIEQIVEVDDDLTGGKKWQRETHRVIVER